MLKKPVFLIQTLSNKLVLFEINVINQRLKLSEPCANIPTTLMNHCGYHRDCYQRITKTLVRLEEVEQTSSSGMNRRSLTAAN